MNKVKRLLSLLLSLVLVLGMVAPAASAEGTGNIEITLVASEDEYAETPISFVKKGETFYITANYKNDNPADKTTQVDLYLQYEPALVDVSTDTEYDCVVQLAEGNFLINPAKAEDVVLFTGMNTGGLKVYDYSNPKKPKAVYSTEGSLFTVKFTAKTNISGDDLTASFKFLQTDDFYSYLASDNTAELGVALGTLDVAIIEPGLNLSTSSVEANGSDEVTVTPVVFDDDGNDITASINNWAVAPTAGGVSIAADGTITVDAKAEAGTYTITGGGYSKELTVTRAASVMDPASVVINGADAVVSQQSGAAEYAYSVSAKDQYGDEMTVSAEWSAETATTASISADGVLSVPEKISGEVVVTATINGKAFTKTVAIHTLVFENVKTTIDGTKLEYGYQWKDIVSATGTAKIGTQEIAGTFTVADPEGYPEAGVDSFTIVFNSADETYENITVVTKGLAPHSIAPKPIAVTGVTAEKNYDGTADFTEKTALTLGTVDSDALVNDDKVTVTTITGGAFASKNAGNSVELVIPGTNVTLSNPNYIASSVSGTGVIIARELTVSGLSLETREYAAGNTSAAVTGTAQLNGAVEGDDVALTGTAAASYEDDTVGTKTAVVTGLDLTGADAANYTLAAIKLTGIVEEKILAASDVEAAAAALVITKVYDGSVSCDAAGTFTVEGVTVNYTAGDYTSKDVGVAGNEVNLILSLSADDDANYELGTNVAYVPATITALDLTGNADVAWTGSGALNVVLNEGSFTEPTAAWKGEAISFASVTYGGKTYADLVTYMAGKAVDYTETFTVVAVPTGNFSGTIETTITLKVVDMEFTVADDAITVADEITYGMTLGEMITNIDASKIDASLKGEDMNGGKFSVADADNVPAAGPAQIKILYTLDGNTYEAAVVPVTVGKKDIADIQVSGIPAKVDYTGSAHEPAVTLTNGKIALVEGTDFTVAYTNNTSVGTASVTITAVEGSNYTGSVVLTFAIEPVELTALTLSDTSFVYNGEAQTVTETVTGVGGATLTKDTDYTVTVSEDQTNVGTVTVTVSGIGNYKGTKTATYEITPAALTSAAVSVDKVTFSGSAQTPAVEVKGVNGVVLSTADYDLTWSEDNVNVGTVTATITGKGNYQGTLTDTFEIEKKAAGVLASGSAKVKYSLEKDLSFTISGVPANAQVDAAAIKVVIDDQTVLGSNAATATATSLTATVGKVAVEKVGQTAKISVTIPSRNYTDFLYVATIERTDKDVPAVTANNLVVAYTGEVLTDAAIIGNNNGYEGTWTWETLPSGTDASETPYAAKVKFVPADSDNYSEVIFDITVTIEKATPIMNPTLDMDEENNITIDSDDETLDDVLNSEDFGVSGEVTWYVTDENGVKTKVPATSVIEEIEGDISWIFTPDDQVNFESISGTASDNDSWLPILGIIIGGAAGGNDFIDVNPGDWFYKAVNFVVSEGLFKGVSNKEFNPHGGMTRAMLVTVMWRLEGSPKAAYNNGFADVEAGSWYDAAVTWASANGLVKGYSSTTFGPYDMITREQMATILFRYAQMRGLNTSYRADLSRYTDAGSISGYAREAMSWAVETGIISGMTETTLNPAATATRAQVATILMRFVKWFGL